MKLQQLSLPNLLLRLEGLTVLLLALAVYFHFRASGLLFVVLILAPDLSALGYLVNPRVGSWSYDLVHTYVLPAVLAAIGLIGGQPLLLNISLIWFAHIGADRLLGYGLKYPTAFKDTHLQRV